MLQPVLLVQFRGGERAAVSLSSHDEHGSVWEQRRSVFPPGADHAACERKSASHWIEDFCRGHYDPVGCSTGLPKTAPAASAWRCAASGSSTNSSIRTVVNPAAAGPRVPDAGASVARKTLAP